jgi:hypothetical protein
MRKFTNILEYSNDPRIRHIRDCAVDLTDLGIRLDKLKRLPSGRYDFFATNDGDVDTLEVYNALTALTDRLGSEGMTIIRIDELTIKKNNVWIKLLIDAPGSGIGESQVKDWATFKEYCESELGISGIEGETPWFRINVVDKDNGWPSLPEEKSGWSIEWDDDKLTAEAFAVRFTGFEDLFLKLAKRKIDYNLVWHLVSDEGDSHRIKDPTKLEEAQRSHNPMRFDQEGVDAVKGLLEAAKRYPGKIKVKSR